MLKCFKMADIIYIQDADGDNSDEGVGMHDQHEQVGEQFDFMPPLLRLEKHASSDNIYHRQLVGRLILETLPHVADNAEEVAAVMGVALKIADDPEPPVRAELMEQVPHITMLCHEDRDRLLPVIADHLLPLVVKFLSDQDNQVRKMSHAALLVMMEQGLVEQAAVEQQVCPVVVQLTEVEGLVEYHTGAIALMAKMAPLLGASKTEELFVPRFTELCSDPAFCIRRACAANIGDLCAVVGTQATEKLLLERYVVLCQDEIWGVRKACAEVVLSISCKCSMGVRKEVLAPAFSTLLSDSSRWVRAAAFASLGPLISTFADPCITGLAYNQLRELVVVNPEGVEFRLCTSKGTEGGDTVLLKYLDAKQSNSGMSFSASFFSAETSDDNEPKPPASSENQSVIKSECDNETSVAAAAGDCTSCDTQEQDSQVRVTESGGLTHIHIESFNNFQYWRVPIPDISLDISLEGGKATAVHVTAKCVDPATQRTFANSLDVNMDIDQDLDKLATDLERGPALGQIRTTSSRLGPPPGRLPPAKWEPDDWWKDLFSHERKEPEASSAPTQPKMPTQVIVPQELVNKFVTMHLASQAQAVDNDIAHHCAFSFPAVVATLGADNWPLLRASYTALAADMQWKVRRTIASSIHEVAVILGEELATKDLVPIFNGFIKDLDEVRIGALKHLSDFLKLLPPPQRNSYLPRLQELLLTDNEWNWRFRQELAEQLYLSVGLFAPRDARKYIMPLGITLLLDKVAAVRHMALNLVNQLIMHVSEDMTLTRGVLSELATQFAHSKKWCRRQMFAYLCARMVADRALDEEEFARDILPHLLDLSWDAVPNVRLAVARTIASPIMDNEYFLSADSPHSDLTVQVMKRLQHDTDRDVRHCALSAPRPALVEATD